MPLKTGALTPMERQFVKHYASTGDSRYSAEKAGYRHAGVQGSQLAAKPDIVAAARAQALEALAGTILPLAVKRHIEILQKAPIGQPLNQAIKLAYQYGIGDGASRSVKEPHEMTGEELAEAIATLKRAASDRARPVVDVEPASVFD